MKIQQIKELVETRNLDELRLAENMLVEEQPTPFEVPGVDEGEKLTHLMAAIWIKHDMALPEGDGAFRTSLRKYTDRVRESIS